MKKQVFNPYLPSYEYIPDGEPYVFDGRLYVYGSHDRFKSGRFCSDVYVLWSADENDLSSWVCHGEIFSREKDPLHHINNNNLHAPDVTRGPDGRYYLYYPHIYYCGVAVSDTPYGPFEFHGRVHYKDGSVYGMGNKEKSIRAVSCDDPAILVDDDGRIWLYTGYVPSNPTLRAEIEKASPRLWGAFCVELEADMLTVKSEPRLIAPGRGYADGTSFCGNEFFEASGIRKIGDTYYFVYSSYRSHDLCYATSKYPDRDFIYRGVLVSCVDGGISEKPVSLLCNTHGNLVKIKDSWYIFYHRSSGSNFARQGCAEKIEMLSDGSFKQAEITSCGLNGGALEASGEYSAHIACNLINENGEKTPHFTQDKPDGEECGQYITNITSGCRVGYKYFDFPDSPLTLTVTLSGDAEGELRISDGKEDLAAISVTPCTDWTDFSVAISFPCGKNPLFFAFYGSGNLEFLKFKFN